ncbi:adenosylcobinamide kinase/adenosylcobinamide phosphate guanyltransferase [Sphingobium sp. Leaf26]|uniref:bifunctional adenosylcobinamide kinase/adenosylcobinamide-phosphate guanylyltransferase n=1 Tax=Sphingobium sp. Leaf26 TaxID=1735693 RepID=UPI0006FBD520|nr:bifunctional adenosylcobinamide kinase/adenosylcobinamide-phosphate guanylyltransferase [Sphingobium sp. Leaf26]KQN08052.1 adenosylcobinamide kinase/adenosylcobinamide phosphate guanyltransferase [Sphingobium sp. Leaf26]
MTLLFVLGGARSGKSRYALSRAEALPGTLVFVATAQALDNEMDSRIARHRKERGPRWRTIEEPFDLAAMVQAEAKADRVLLIDCLTLWASNLLLADHDIDAATGALVMALGEAQGPVILVANEVGLGIVPDNALARRFRDVAGTVNQAVAACVDEAVFMAAGLPMRLK